jgi:hypothetical protein
VAQLIAATVPPREVQRKIVEDALQEHYVRFASHKAVCLVDCPGGPCLHRQLHVGKGPLEARYLPVGSHVPAVTCDFDLSLREITID